MLFVLAASLLCYYWLFMAAKNKYSSTYGSLKGTVANEGQGESEAGRIIRTHDALGATHMPLHAPVTLQPAGAGTAPALSGARVARCGKRPVRIALTLLAPAAIRARVTVETRGAPAET